MEQASVLNNLANTFKKPVPREKAYRWLGGIAVAGIIFFLVLYLLNRTPTSVFIPGGGLAEFSAPRQVGMIYGPFGEGQLDKPMDVTVGGGRVYVSDTNNQRVQVFDQDGNFLLRFGSRGREPGQFLFPYGLALDAAGRLYVADLYTGRVSVFDGEGNFMNYLGEEGELRAPGDLFIKDEELYVTDIDAGKVLVFNLQGQLLRQFGGTGREPGQLRAPNGVAVDDEGNAWVVDTGNQRVQVFDPQGRLKLLFNGNPDPNAASIFMNPRGIGLRGRTVLVVSNLTHNVFGFNRQGDRELSFGGLGDQLSQFTLPNGLFVAADGRIYITDSANMRVAVYQ